MLLAFSPLEAPWWHVVAVGFGVGASPRPYGRLRLPSQSSPRPVSRGHARPWARWRYGDGKLSRSRARFADTRPLARAHRRLGDLVTGAPSEEP